MMASLTMDPPPPAVGLDEVKAFLRLAHSQEDALIAGFMRSAQAACEAFTGVALVDRATVETVEASSRWLRLGLAPVRSIDGVVAVLGDGGEATLAAEAYAIDIDAAGDGWVRMIQTGSARRLRVSYRAGLAADWNDVAEPLRQGIVRLTAHLYSHRGQIEPAPPSSVAALWRPWRRLRVA